MPLLVLSPLLLCGLLYFFQPELAQLISNNFPTLVYALLVLTIALSVLMRQWQWLYSLILLASHYFTVRYGLQQPVSKPDVAMLSQLLPLLFTLQILLLQLRRLPQLPTTKGILLLLFCLAGPPSLLLLPLDTLAVSFLPSAFMQPLSMGFAVTWGQLWWMCTIGASWLALLSFYRADSKHWGQFSAWLTVMLIYLLLAKPHISGWLTLAASLTLLLTLANQMLQLAYIDELTGLPQRRALLNHLNRLGRRSAVTMLDVDHFKKFNDTYGHDVGDQVLRLLGSVLGSENNVQAYRYGGEEFTLVFSHNNPDKLADKLEQVRAKVADYPLVIRQQDRPQSSKTGKQQRGATADTNKVVHVTISLGCAIRRPGENTEQLLKRADEALYKAKKAGRNRVAFAS